MPSSVESYISLQLIGFTRFVDVTISQLIVFTSNCVQKISQSILLPLTSPSVCFGCNPEMKNKKDDELEYLDEKCETCGYFLCAPVVVNMSILDFPTMLAHLYSPRRSGLDFDQVCTLGIFECSFCENPRVFKKFSKKRDILMNPLNDNSSSHVYGCKVFQTGQNIFWYWCRARDGFVYMGLQYLGPREKAAQFLYHACVFSPSADVKHSFYHPLYEITENLLHVENEKKCFVMEEEKFNRIFFTDKSRILLIISDRSKE